MLELGSAALAVEMPMANKAGPDAAPTAYHELTTPA